MLTKEQRLFVLDLIYEKRENLFGKFNARRSADDIDKEWRSLWDACVEANMPFAKVNRGPKYLRNNVWQYIRRTTLVTQLHFLWMKMQSVQEKIDGNRRTGAAGGREAQLSEVDVRVLDILGRDNATVTGICDDHEGEMVPCGVSFSFFDARHSAGGGGFLHQQRKYFHAEW